MFALANLEPGDGAVISFCAGQERYSELLEREGIFPAPYLARAYWVGVERWDVLRPSEWKEELTAAHTMVFSKLPKRTRDIFAMPSREQKRFLSERRAVLATRRKNET